MAIHQNAQTGIEIQEKGNSLNRKYFVYNMHLSWTHYKSCH